MDKVNKDIRTIDVQEEFRICPNCGYQRGFHVPFIPKEGKKTTAFGIYLS